MASRISNAAAIAAGDAIVNLLDVTAAGSIIIRTGAAPTNCEDATTGTNLATMTLNSQAFDNGVDGNPNAVFTLQGVPKEDTSADATGTAGYFRFLNNAGTCVFQGTCGAGSGELSFNTVSISAGAIVSITAFTVTIAEVGT